MMADSIPPLADQALSRLRKLAEGNGLSPDKIELVEAQEKTYVIEGITHLTPFCEIHTAAYAGPVHGKERTILPNIGALRMEAQRRQHDFYEKRAWLPAALEELKTATGEGWGLDGAKIGLPQQSVILAANDTCPGCQGRKMFTCVQCHGQGTVVCTYCAGKGLEICYNCAGRGVNPAHPDQPCVICHGKRYIPCRFCKSSGHLICPTCLGKKGTICPQCMGAGVSTQEIALACGATINFSLKGDAWPSGLRRGLDRLGIVNLIKGHADVVRVPDEPPQKGDDEETAAQKKSAAATVRYHATLPYADLRMRFGGGRVMIVSVFGKRGLTMGVPPFLDDALKPARDKLRKAVLGKLALDKVLGDARAMRDAFALVAAGKRARRKFPQALSVGLVAESDAGNHAGYAPCPASIYAACADGGGRSLRSFGGYGAGGIYSDAGACAADGQVAHFWWYGGGFNRAGRGDGGGVDRAWQGGSVQAETQFS